eukprot:TRINITY_DN26563_c0_g1_i1.p1 TRINITY_DN26563_c0_g1~~TRINITY_DN26563_c0_g1_i1.p1  ORF type:complete len:122 (-),score=44.70 TRINITY_DN26563_c0_g1_i1:143-508(-)
MRCKKEAKDEVKTLLSALNKTDGLSKEAVDKLCSTPAGEDFKPTLDPENTAWVNAWKQLPGEFSEDQLMEAYVEAYVAQKKVELWAEREAIQRAENEAPPLPPQFCFPKGGSDAPLWSMKL